MNLEYNVESITVGFLSHIISIPLIYKERHVSLGILSPRYIKSLYYSCLPRDADSPKKAEVSSIYLPRLITFPRYESNRSISIEIGVYLMGTLTPEREQSFQEESFEDTSSKDSESDLQKESGGSESPLTNDNVSGGEGGGEGHEVSSAGNAIESSATVSSMTITVAEAPVRCNNVRVGEGTVNNNIVRVPPEKRSLYKFGQRTSNFRGVTRHRWTGKYEAHLWDNSTITEGRKRKGKQVYLGGYETEEKAAQIYDLAALKYWGANANTKLNFPICNYESEIEEMKSMSREEYVNSLRRNSICFTRGCSIYRGVTRQNVGRRWQARIGRVAGGKDIYLGTYDTEEEAAEAYDIAAVKLRGMNAITNFDISNYYKEGTKELDVIPIKSLEEESSTLKIRYFKLK